MTNQCSLTDASISIHTEVAQLPKRRERRLLLRERWAKVRKKLGENDGKKKYNEIQQCYRCIKI